MTRNIKDINLTSSAFSALELGYKSANKQFSNRCHIILLKSKNFTCQEVSELLFCSKATVSNWQNRYERGGIEALKTKKGQGRKSILTKEEDEIKIRFFIAKERQRLKLIKEDLEQDLGKKFSLDSLKRFLKSLAVNGKE